MERSRPIIPRSATGVMNIVCCTLSPNTEIA
jgi:hypothetical protein